MIQNSKNKIYDLEDRTTNFAKDVIRFVKILNDNTINRPLIGQIVRSAGSIGANYREANDALGKKDFILRLRISRKEAKETIPWLEVLEEANKRFGDEIKKLKVEAIELRNILSAITSKSIPKK